MSTTSTCPGRGRGGDPLAPGDDWWNTACLNFLPGPQWFAMARGFKMQADLAVDHVMQGRRDQDFLVFPVLANYRQYIELSLKSIIRDARLLLEEPGEVPFTHSLESLWGTTTGLLSRIEPRADQRDIRNVGECLKRFHDLDPTSQETSYPIDRQGNSTLAGLRNVNLRQVREVVERLSSFIDAVSMTLSVNLDHKAEMEAEYRTYADGYA